ncbi:N-methylproline demethylase [Chromatiales bacterium (ex Bugula neritina AB1)]|nr:N-methylproline demethylase [Chromatiales bacterium (ex Bugula neritina AB1)]
MDSRHSNDPLFQPLELGHLTLKNRIMSTSHASGTDDQGMPGERYQRYHEEKAKGGLALTMFGGSSNVAPDSPSVFDQLRVDSDAVIPYLQQFSERIHSHDTALMCQITHLGRRGDATADNWLPTIAPSVVRETLHRSIPREMDEHDIKRVVRSFGAAARRCYEGGLDGLETHAGAHLIGQFFSPDTNRRSDKYGGSLQNRMRFALMVHEEIRKQVGDNFLLGIRMSLEEDRGGLSHDEALQIAQTLQQEGAIDFLNCVFGRMDTEIALAENNMPGMKQPLAPFLERMRTVRQAVTLPIFHAARIVDIATARYAVRDGLLDMVAMTRAHIADPQIVNKIQRGEEHRIRPCFGASHCMHKKPSCIHNVATGRELELPQVISASPVPGRKVVVVGAGPAGLEAARVAAERGHKVTILEAASKPGGQILMAARTEWRHDLMAVIDWRLAELEHLGVKLKLNCYAESEDVLALQPDTVIIATGGLPNLHGISGEQHCISSWDILGGDIQPAEKIIVFDGTGRHEAASCAQYLAARGATVTLASIDDRPTAELGYAERASHRKQLYKQGITMLQDLMLLEVKSSGNRISARFRNDLTDEPLELIADQIIVERGTVPVDELFYELKSNAVNSGDLDLEALLEAEPQPGNDQQGYTLYRVGDAVSSRSMHAAILDSYRLAIAL